jgi:activating signal cointegrator 1
MKALTLTQPWATLVAIGAKKIETRSWSTYYRGPLAIHAAKTLPTNCRSSLWFQEPFLTALSGTLVTRTKDDIWDRLKGHPENLHLGCVIATCMLANVFEIEENRFAYPSWSKFYIPPDEPELSFGDYTPGRFAWILEDVKRLLEPIPAKGALGLWEWRKP